MESLYLLFVLFFIVLLVFPFTFTLKFAYDVKNNCGAISLGLFFNFFVAKLKRKGTEILLITQKRNTNVNLEVGEKQLKFVKHFKEEIQNKVKIRKVNVYSKLGSENPFVASMFSSTFSIAVSIFLSRLKIKQPTGSFVYRPTTIFSEGFCAAAVTAKVAVSLFDVLFSFIMAVLKTRKDRKQEESFKNV